MMVAKVGQQNSGGIRHLSGDQNAEAFRNHLQVVLDSPPFKASRRSLEFLRHIVEKVISGHTEDLKERSLGVDLFGRVATYDTGADAIVRVTASDVRRRLQQYYSEFGLNSEYRIELPAGSYVPEFKHYPRAVSSPVQLPEKAEASRDISSTHRINYGILLGLLVVAAGVCFWLWSDKPTSPRQALAETLPWSVLFSPERDLRIVFCDTDISLTQGILNYRLSLSDYANQRYIPDSISKDPLAQRIIQAHRGLNIASIDAKIAVNLSSMSNGRVRSIKTHPARSLHILDFKTEDNFVILGSPRSNPWLELFQDQLHFRFEYDPASRQEIIRNYQVAPGENAVYIPTAQGGGTGEAYALLALIPNPSHKGEVLLLAGSNAEATEAAGKLVMDREQLLKTFRENNVDLKEPNIYFEILMRVTTMAGSPDKFQVIAFHRLSPP